MCLQLVEVSKENLNQSNKCSEYCVDTWSFPHELCQNTCNKISAKLNTRNPCSESEYCPLPNGEGTPHFKGEKFQEFIQVQRF